MHLANAAPTIVSVCSPILQHFFFRSRAGLDFLCHLLIALLSSNGILPLLVAGFIRLTIAAILPHSEHRWFVNISVSPNSPHQHCRLVASSRYVCIPLLRFQLSYLINCVILTVIQSQCPQITKPIARRDCPGTAILPPPMPPILLHRHHHGHLSRRIELHNLRHGHPSHTPHRTLRPAHNPLHTAFHLISYQSPSIWMPCWSTIHSALPKNTAVT